MNQHVNIINNNKQSKIVFSSSLFTLIYVAIFKNIDPYKYIVVGALFEILWLFIVAAIFIILTVVIVVFIWGTKTLAHYRYN